MRPTCEHDGCTEPVGKNRSKWCGPEHAYAGRLAWMREWNVSNERRVEKRRGYAHNRPSRARPVVVDIDEVAVIRAVRGELDGITLNRHERRQAVGLLVRRGLPSHEIADRVGATVRTVRRDRAALRRAA